MSENNEKVGIGITVFKPGTPKKSKVYDIIFFIFFCLIILVQAFYWLFANSVSPYILGMPFGMFFIVLFIIIEFIGLAVLFAVGEKEENEGGSK